MKKPDFLSLDSLIELVGSLGLPGLAFVLLCKASGLVGAAAMTSTLALLGGPVGMIGGVLGFGGAVILMRYISKYGADKVAEIYIKSLYNKGETKATIIYKINNWPITNDLKRKLCEQIELLP